MSRLVKSFLCVSGVEGVTRVLLCWIWAIESYELRVGRLSLLLIVFPMRMGLKSLL